MVMSDGNVVMFPGSTKSDDDDDLVHAGRRCDHCVHFMSGFLGQFCRAYEEDIMSVHEAEGCGSYEAM